MELFITYGVEAIFSWEGVQSAPGEDPETEADGGGHPQGGGRGREEAAG